MKILIPTYNPNEKLINLINQIKEITSDEIIIINDGSNIQSNKIFEQLSKMNVKVLQHKNNKGKGEALKTGFKYLLEINESEGCVCADSDGQHTPKDILKIINKLKEGKKDLILGVRNFKEKNIPFRSKFGNKISILLFGAMTGQRISDTQTGLRGYSSKIFKWLLTIEGSRYEYEFNMLLNLKENNISYEEISIQTIYENNNEVSHFRPIKDSILIYKPVIKFIGSSSLATIIDFVLLFTFKYILKNLLLSVIFSRTISSIVNFIINKQFVFNVNNKKSSNTLKMICKYYGLVVVIMILNYSLLNFLYNIVNINLVISKIITEIILYLLSFIVQKRFVFKK